MTLYRKSEVAWFKSKTDPFWELSNMAGGMPMYWPLDRREANRWGSSEQLYQASKYSTSVTCTPKSNLTSDPNVRARIRAATNPRGAKMTQKCAAAAGLIREDWSSEAEVRIASMRWVLELKLYHNRSTFGRALLATGDLPIVEVSSKDPFWGCLEVGGDYLRGDNHLGLLLMEVRLKRDQILKGEFSHPGGFLLS